MIKKIILLLSVIVLFLAAFVYFLKGNQNNKKIELIYDDDYILESNIKKLSQDDISNYKVVNGTKQLLDVTKHILSSEGNFSFYNDKLYLKNNEKYLLSFKYEGDIKLKLNISSYEKNILSVDVKKGDNNFEFINSSKSDYYKLSYETEEKGNFNISDISIENLSFNNQDIRINQVGYQIGLAKNFVCPNYFGDYFKVVDAKSNEVVYKKNFNSFLDAPLANEQQFFGNFSDFNKEGTYYLVTEYGLKSFPFTISKKPYAQMTNDILKMITMQRCGQDLAQDSFGLFGHRMCHQEEGILYPVLDYEGVIKKKIVGGWHDAGDYGRYSQTIIKTLNDLMLSYHFNKNNALLEEIRWGLEFLLNMQNVETGGIFLKIVSKNFAAMVYPDQDNSQLYIFRENTNVTASSVLNFYWGASLFETVDEEFKNRLIEAGNKSYDYIVHNGFEGVYDDKSFDAGHYHDDDDRDERFNAYVAKYLFSKEEKDLVELEKYFKSFKNDMTYGFDYDKTDAYGTIYYLLYGQKNSELYQELEKAFLNKAHYIYDLSYYNAYHISKQELYWGSNYRLLDDSKTLYLASILKNNKQYKEMALMNLNYVFGVNGLNMSFVTGYGINYPTKLHHRISIANKEAFLKGGLVGGVDYSLNYYQDIKNTEAEKALLKRYKDDYSSYTTNEVAIYYNSSLYFLLSVL